MCIQRQNILFDIFYNFRLEEKEFLLTQVNDELKKEKARLEVLNEEIEVQKQKNNVCISFISLLYSCKLFFFFKLKIHA